MGLRILACWPLYMETPQERLSELFVMFHDFEIVQISFTDKTLSLTIAVPWSQLWDEDGEFYRIELMLFGCERIHCTYYEYRSKDLIQDESGTHYDLIEKETEDVAEIAGLELDVQSYSYDGDNNYVFHCDGRERINFAEFRFSAVDYQIVDWNGQVMTFEAMRKWGNDWWQSIQDMWDRQRRDAG